MDFPTCDYCGKEYKTKKFAPSCGRECYDAEISRKMGQITGLCPEKLKSGEYMLKEDVLNPMVDLRSHKSWIKSGSIPKGTRVVVKVYGPNTPQSAEAQESNPGATFIEMSDLDHTGTLGAYILPGKEWDSSYNRNLLRAIVPHLSPVETSTDAWSDLIGLDRSDSLVRLVKANVITRENAEAMLEALTSADTATDKAA